MGSVRPDEITNLLGPLPDSGSITIGGRVFEAGSFLSACDGERYLHGTTYDQVIFMQTATNGNIPAYHQGRFFSQGKSAFVSDCDLGDVGAGVTKRTNATKAVIKSFLDVYLGAMACAGGPVAWGITGMKVFVVTGQVIRDYRTYEDALVAILASRATIRTKMPTLYRTVFWELYFGTVEKALVGKSKDILSEAVPGPKVAGKLVGVLLGAIGEDKLGVRLKAMKEILHEVLVKVATHAMEHDQKLGTKEIVLSEEQVGLLADKHILRILKTVNILLPSLNEAKEIIRETVRNWNLRTDFKKMADALDKLG